MLWLAANYFEQQSLLLANIEPTITRIFGLIEGDSEVHSKGRAIDFRDHYDGDFTYSPIIREQLLDRVNQMFPRGDGHQTLIWHRFGDGPSHFHLQVSWNVSVYVSMLGLRSKA